MSAADLDALIASVSREQIAPLILALAAKLLERPAESQQAEPPNLLTVEQAAARLHRSPRWIYRHCKRLPFCHRVSRKVLLVNGQKMEQWIATQKA